MICPLLFLIGRTLRLPDWKSLYIIKIEKLSDFNPPHNLNYPILENHLLTLITIKAGANFWQSTIWKINLFSRKRQAAKKFLDNLSSHLPHNSSLKLKTSKKYNQVFLQSSVAATWPAKKEIIRVIAVNS